MKLTAVVSGFDDPTFVTSFPNNPNLLVIVERAGKIKLVNTTGPILWGYPGPALFLDLTDRVQSINPFEGLTGFAFHPRFTSPSKRWVYVYYNSQNADGMLTNQSRVERFWVPTNTPHQADKATGEVIWENEDATCAIGTCQGFGSSHVSGRIHFGPEDDKLYIGVPDHTMPNGPPDLKLLSQNLSVFWGKLLRVGVAGGIPNDNPFKNNTNGYKEEIWAYGLRNPYGFSFDSMTGDLWIGDVGHLTEEEINFTPAVSGPFTALNYGWPCREGSVNHVTIGDCNPLPTVENPFATYSHNTNGSAVLGGYVYRGTGINWDTDGNSKVNGLELRYFYADHVENRIWSVSPNDTSAPVAVVEHTADLELGTLFSSDSAKIWGFGQDSVGELYVIRVNEDEPAETTIFRIEEE